jgi:Icc-related predicted phosphoesterase
MFPDTRVIYVCGNHEFYGEKHPSLIGKLREEARGSNVTVLENERVSIGGYRIFGCTLWTDMSLLGDVRRGMEQAVYMNDYHRIRSSVTYRKLRAIDTCKYHAESLAHLKRFLDEGDPCASIVVTHHAPSPQSVPERYRKDPLSAAFASDLEILIYEKQPCLWVHGHLHDSFSYHLGATRVVCNPRGYVREENPDFLPGLVVEV